RREDELHAECLHAEDVRAEVQLRRRHTMAAAMPRQERDALATQRAEQVRRRGLTKRRRHVHFLAVGHARHVVQAGPANDAYLRSLHSCLSWDLEFGFGRWDFTFV